MLSVKCDRCGKSARVEKEGYTAEVALAATIYTRDGDSEIMTRAYDLCADCTKDLKRWIETSFNPELPFPFNLTKVDHE